MMSFNEATASVANQVRESSPILCIALGVATLISAGVAACMATRSAEPILDEHKEKIAKIKEKKEEGLIDEKAASKQVGKTYVRTMGKVAIKAAPALVLTGVGIGVIGFGYHLEHARYIDTKDKLTTTLAALTGVTTEYNAYRMRNRERFGPEVDNEILYDIHKEQVEETVVDEKGKEKKLKREVTHTGPVGTPGYGIYSRWFNKDSDAWVNNAEMNRTTLETIEHKLNVKLCVEGVVSVNDVYKELRLKDEFDQPMKTKAGQVMGWIYDPESTDTQITLGICEPINQDFVNGKSPDCLISLMPEGNVWELMSD